MKQKTLFVFVSLVCVSALILAQAPPAAQAPAAQGRGGGGAAAAAPAPCIPPDPAPAAAAAAAPAAGGGRGAGAAGQGQQGQAAAPAAARGPAPPRGEPAAIPGILAAGAKWTRVWQQGGNSADGVVMDKDGNILVAQEDYDNVLKIDKNDMTSVFVANAKGVGSLSMDKQGNLYGAHRTERAGSTKPDKDQIVNAITMLAPTRKVIADKWSDGKILSVRPNDLAADSQGGVYFTIRCVFYASPTKGVTVAAENLNTNGIVFSPDNKILYVTNGGSIVAFDVAGPGMLTNRRDFTTMNGGDGMAVDSEGRLYVTSNPGVQVFDKTGKHLGAIPTPRGLISVGFGGPDRKTLYGVGGGADDENGKPIQMGPQNTAATIYKIPMLSQGLKDRGK